MFCESDLRRSGPTARAWIGAPASTLASISNMKPSPEPLAPPSGSKISARLGSVVGSPSRVSALFGGSDALVVRACRMVPLEMALVAMSRITAPSPLGTAIAIGLVPRLATRAP